MFSNIKSCLTLSNYMEISMSIQSVKRALEILSLFSSEQPRLGLTEISRAMGLPKPTVHGLVHTMMDLEFLSQDPETRKYALGRKLYELGSVFTSNIRINQVGSMSAQQLAAKTGMTASLSIWDNGSVVMTFRGVSNYPNVQPQQFVSRFPAYCSSQGKAILSALSEEQLNRYLNTTPLVAFSPNTITDPKRLREELNQSREKGFAVDREEFIIGVSCMGAPVLDHTGSPVGAISLSGKGELLFGDQMIRLASDLMQTAMEISYKMGYLPGIQNRAYAL
jgi:DNA-binding IclR family transcriptional regulator